MNVFLRHRERYPGTTPPKSERYRESLRNKYYYSSIEVVSNLMLEIYMSYEYKNFKHIYVIQKEYERIIQGRYRNLQN